MCFLTSNCFQFEEYREHFFAGAADHSYDCAYQVLKKIVELFRKNVTVEKNQYQKTKQKNCMVADSATEIICSKANKEICFFVYSQL
jgi:hypothetical protein